MMSLKTFNLPLLCLPLVLAGCSLARAHKQTAQKPVCPVEPAEALAEPTDQPDEPLTTDPHQAETVAQVLDFVDRLGDASAADEDPSSDRSDQARADAAEPPRDQTTATGMTANAPAAVSAPPSPDLAGDVAIASARQAVPVIESVFISGGEVDQPAEPAGPPASAANSPLSTDPPDRARSLEELIDALTERVKSAPQDAAAQWKLRLLQLVVGNEQAARDVSEEGADFDCAVLLGELVDVIVATREALEDPVTASDTALAAASALRTTLSEQADLQIPAVALCTRVQTFGVYDEMPPGALLPSRANRAIIYVEIANFFSELTPAGQYRTRLSGELEVLTAAGASVWRHEEPDIVDLSRQRRHDFFLAQLITLPGSLGPGEYVLKVTIQDELSGKSNQAIHPFAMGTSAVAGAGP